MYKRQVGKLLLLSTRAKADIPLIPRTISRKALTRACAGPRSSCPFKSRVSESSDGSKVTFVRDSSPPRFMEIEPLDGRRRSWSRLPQYLIKAMLGLAMVVAVCMFTVYRIEILNSVVCFLFTGLRVIFYGLDLVSLPIHSLPCLPQGYR